MHRMTTRYKSNQKNQTSENPPPSVPSTSKVKPTNQDQLEDVMLRTPPPPIATPRKSLVSIKTHEEVESDEHSVYQSETENVSNNDTPGVETFNENVRKERRSTNVPSNTITQGESSSMMDVHSIMMKSQADLMVSLVNALTDLSVKTSNSTKEIFEKLNDSSRRGCPEIPDFDADDNKDFDNWCLDVEARKEFHDWTEETTMRKAFSAIHGPALATVKNLIGLSRLRKMSWTVFKNEASVFFPSDTRGVGLLQRMRRRHQKSDEPARDYITDKIGLIAKANPNMDVLSQLMEIREGLQPSLKHEIDRKVNYTTCDLPTYINIIVTADLMTSNWKREEKRSNSKENESTKSTLQKNNDEKHKSTYRRSLSNTYRQFNRRNTPNNGDNRSENTTKEETSRKKVPYRHQTYVKRTFDINKIQCNKCKLYGHFASSCPQTTASTSSKKSETQSTVNNVLSKQGEGQGAIFTVESVIKGHKISCMLDTGANISIMSSNLARRLEIEWDPTTPDVKMTDGSKGACVGLTSVIVGIGGDEYTFKGVQIWDKSTFDFIVGTKILAEYFVIDLVDCRLYRRDNIIIYEKTPKTPMKLSKANMKKLSSCIVSTEEKNSFDIDVELEETERKRLFDLLDNYRHCFASSSKELGKSKLEPFKITLRDEKPFTTPRRRMNPLVQKEIEKQILEMEAANIIRRSSSPFSSEIVVVKKPNGESRLCVDFRQLNDVTISDSYPLQLMDEVLQSFKNARYFATMDLYAGYWQMPMEETSILYTAFSSSVGLFEFLRMPFGLKNAPAAFQRAMDSLFMKRQQTDQHPRKYRIYLDDIIIWGSTIDEFLMMLREVLEIFTEISLKAKYTKCKFGYKEITFLGHRVNNEGIKPLDDKIKIIKDLENVLPQNKRQLRRFLGLASFYRAFIPSFAHCASSLYELLRKDVSFEWTSRRTAAYQDLVSAFRSPAMLAYYDASKPLIIESDASDFAVSAILKQPDDDNVLKVITYYGRLLGKAERNYCTTEKEFLAFICAVKKFRHFTIANKVIWITDHSAISTLTKTKESRSSRVQRWLMEIQDIDLKIMHEKGANHHLADCLSRLPFENQSSENNTDVPVINANVVYETPREKMDDTAQNELDEIPSDMIPTSDLAKSQEKDFLCQEIVKAESNNHAHRQFRVINGLVCKVKTDDVGIIPRVVVPRRDVDNLLRSLHFSEYMGHPGQARMIRLICTKYWWPNMRYDIRDVVRKCESCQIRKLTSTKHYGKLVPLTFRLKKELDEPFSCVGMDVIVLNEKPTKSKNRYILTVIDYLTRYGLALPMRDQKASTVLSVLVENVFTKFGIPNVIITDRGTNFTSVLIETVLKELKVKHNLTSAYHPEANGLCEKFNGTIKKAVAHFVNAGQSNWDTLIHPLTYGYNAIPAEATGIAPFKLLFGRTPRLPTNLNDSLILERFKRDRTCFREFRSSWQDALRCLLESAEAMKVKADKKRLSADFEIGNVVLLLNMGSVHDVARSFRIRYSGPYMILNLMNENVSAEIVHMITGEKIIVHVKRLKKYFSKEHEFTIKEASVDVQDVIDVDKNFKTSKNTKETHIVCENDSISTSTAI